MDLDQSKTLDINKTHKCNNKVCNKAMECNKVMEVCNKVMEVCNKVMECSNKI